LAGTRLLAALGGDSAVAPARGFVLAATILCWSLATWWIPLLAGLTLWRHRPGEVRPGYRLDNWAIVFPLGMYTAATWRFLAPTGTALSRYTAATLRLDRARRLVSRVHRHVARRFPTGV